MVTWYVITKLKIYKKACKNITLKSYFLNK